MTRSFASRLRRRAVVTGAILSLVGPHIAAAEQLGQNDGNTTTPIKHVIVIIGENRTFDHVYGTYTPPGGQTVLNLLSQKIWKANGQPGKNAAKTTEFGQPAQNTAVDEGGSSTEGTYAISPGTKAAYTTLPEPGAAGAPTTASDTEGPPFATLETAANYEYGLLPGDLYLITTGATGLASTSVPDSRIANYQSLPDGPFRLTGKTLPYDSYTGSPVHRFYQMWQQTDCAGANATTQNPTGCLSDLFPWVETTIATGTNGSIGTPAGVAEGSTSMGMYDMAAGDAPYFKSLAETYTIGDNYHQGVMGGTGANHIMIGFADSIYYTDGTDGTPTTPPAGQIEDPNPQAATNNVYVNDGYGSTATNDGGSYTECSDTTQPGVAPITTYLAAIGITSPVTSCEAGAYYLLNNYNPGYFGNGTVATGTSVSGPFTVPPTTRLSIGDSLNTGSISWAYYGESWTDYVSDPDGQTNPAGYLYCNICNPFQYETAIMTSSVQRSLHLHDTTDLYNDIADGNLPAVSFVKPSALNDGHPASSKLDLFESFTHKIIKELKQNKDLWADTAVVITWDEGGGYWDSGYIQPVDFFGDGTRIPVIVVSSHATGGKVVHTYYDHASIAKFIEANWSLSPITSRSRDNLANPTVAKGNPYVPTNRPAIGNLMDMFSFSNKKKTPKD